MRSTEIPGLEEASRLVENPFNDVFNVAGSKAGASASTIHAVRPRTKTAEAREPAPLKDKAAVPPLILLTAICVSGPGAVSGFASAAFTSGALASTGLASGLGSSFASTFASGFASGFFGASLLAVSAMAAACALLALPLAAMAVMVGLAVPGGV